MDLHLTDHVVLITGANGGIGRALAEGFAAEGCRLALLAGRSLDALERWVGSRPWADRAACAAADVRDPDALDVALGSLQGRFGPMHHAVVNAGIWPEPSVLLASMEEARIRDVIDVDLLGALLTARAFLGRVSPSGPAPSLTFIGSTAGQFGEPGHAVYAACKAALRGATLSLKNEIVHLHPGGRVNLVDPGWTRTPMAEGAMADEVQVRRSLSTTPLRKVGEPEDVASTCVFLASSRAGHVSGQVIGVHGGMEGRLLW